MHYHRRNRAHAPFVTRVAAILLPLLVVTSAAVALAGSHDPPFVRSDYPPTQVVDETYALKDGGMLRIDVDDVDVYIREAEGKTSHVGVFVAGPDADRAVEFFEDQLDFAAEMNGNELTISSRGPEHGSASFWQAYRRVQVWMIVSIPSRCNGDITTNDGDLRIDHLDGEITIRTDDGDVDVRSLTGSMIDIRSEDGDISAGTLDATDVEINTSDGDVAAQRIKGTQVSVSSSDGDITVENIEGEDITMRTSDGDVEVKASGKDLKIDCRDGDMQVTLLDAMTVDLVARDGDIDIVVPQSLHLDLELRGDDVRVRGGNLTKGNITNRGVVGSLNDGGPLVRAKTNDGSIALRLR